MTKVSDAEPGEPPAAPVLSGSVVGGDNLQITSARDVTIVSRRPGRTSLLRLLSVGVVLAIGATAAITRPALVDTARDLTGTPVLTGAATSMISVGDSLAMRGDLSGPEQAVLLRGPSDTQLAEILSRHHAARVDGMEVVLILQGQRNAPIRIIDVRPRVVRSGPRPTGTCLTMPVQGEESEYEVKVDLDTQKPAGGGSRFLDKSIDLADGERATVLFTVKASKRWYEWDIEVVYVRAAGGRSESVFFRDTEGQPFRITGHASKYSTVWNDPSSIGVGYRITGKDQRCFAPEESG